eukprot:357903-Chlamydomonas_euryale.AAC.3
MCTAGHALHRRIVRQQSLPLARITAPPDCEAGIPAACTHNSTASAAALESLLDGTSKHCSNRCQLDDLRGMIATTAMACASGRFSEMLPSLFCNAGPAPVLTAFQISSAEGASAPIFSDGQELAAVVSVSPFVAALPATRSALMEVVVTLSGALRPNFKLAARHCTQGFLAVSQTEASYNQVRVTFAAPQQPGRVHFEVIDEGSGMQGVAAALLLLPTKAAAAELLGVQNSTSGLPDAATQPARPHPVTTDVGMWIDTMLMDSCGAMDDGRRQEAERVCHALLRFCDLMRLDAIRDMLMALKQSVYVQQPQPLWPPDTSPSSTCPERMQHWWARNVPGLRQHQVKPGASHMEPLPNGDPARWGAALPVQPSSLLHRSSIWWTLGKLSIILFGFVQRSPGMISHLGAALHCSEILLLATAALRAIAWQRLARLLDKIEVVVRPHYGALVYLNKVVFSFVAAAGLLDVHSAVPKLPPLGVFVLVPVLDLGFVFLQSPIKPMRVAIAAAAVHGLGLFCVVRSYSGAGAFVGAVLVTVTTVAVHVLPERWTALHVGRAAQGVPHDARWGGWAGGCKPIGPLTSLTDVAMHCARTQTMGHARRSKLPLMLTCLRDCLHWPESLQLGE